MLSKNDFSLLAVAALVATAAALPSSGATSTCPKPVTASPTVPASARWWKPPVGASWNIALAPKSTPPALTYNYSTYDLDLFDNDASVFANLHAKGKKVICYFSAGSGENWRPDYSCLKKADFGKPLDGWEGEKWLKTSSANVRAIMLARLDLAVQKGCDGVDPDNVDGYDNDNGIGLTQDDAVSYVSFLADAAHARGLAVGLKNAADVAPRLINKMEWQVNEECIELGECDSFDLFIQHGKPVFNIEYPPEDHIEKPWKYSEEVDRCKQHLSAASNSGNFSTVLKNYLLDEWVKTCTPCGQIV